MSQGITSIPSRNLSFHKGEALVFYEAKAIRMYYFQARTKEKTFSRTPESLTT